MKIYYWLFIEPLLFIIIITIIIIVIYGVFCRERFKRNYGQIFR